MCRQDVDLSPGGIDPCRYSAAGGGEEESHDAIQHHVMALVCGGVGLRSPWFSPALATGCHCWSSKISNLCGPQQWFELLSRLFTVTEASDLMQRDDAESWVGPKNLQAPNSNWSEKNLHLRLADVVFIATRLFLHCYWLSWEDHKSLLSWIFQPKFVLLHSLEQKCFFYLSSYLNLTDTEVFTDY